MCQKLGWKLFKVLEDEMEDCRALNAAIKGLITESKIGEADDIRVFSDRLKYEYKCTVTIYDYREPEVSLEDLMEPVHKISETLDVDCYKDRSIRVENVQAYDMLVDRTQGELNKMADKILKRRVPKELCPRYNIEIKLRWYHNKPS